MKGDKIIIFTEAFRNTGLGHLGRCTALWEVLSESNDVVFLVVDTDGTLLHGEEKPNLIYLNWKDNSNLNKILSSMRPDIVYIDSYLANVSIYEKISLSGLRLICIDDFNRLQYPDGATILNPGLGGKFLPYDYKRNKILTGIEYVLLRKPFRETASCIRTRKSPESILVTLGAEDRYGLMPILIQFLCDTYQNWIKHIIIGPAFRNFEEIKEATDENCLLHVNLSAYEMRDIMLSSDLAITAGGQTTYELNHCNTPMILIETAENQQGNIRGWIEWKNTPFVGKATDVELIGNLKRTLANYANHDFN